MSTFEEKISFVGNKMLGSQDLHRLHRKILGVSILVRGFNQKKNFMVYCFKLLLKYLKIMKEARKKA